MRRKSKSEILLDLSDPAKHDAAVREVLRDPRIRVPADRLFGDDRERWRDYVAENRCKRYYKFFDGLSDDAAGDGPSVLERLRHVSLGTAKSMLRNGDLPSGPEPEGLGMRIFYYSCLVYRHGRLADECVLLRLAEKAYASIGSGEMARRDLFRSLFVRFTSPAVLKYLRSSIMREQEALGFLRFVACRLDKHVIELWFSERLVLDDRLFSGLRQMSISENTGFDREVFAYLLRYRVFRRHIFNYWKNTEFVLGMREFCNRADYEFYYGALSVDYRPSCPPPHDSERYAFFRSVVLSAADYRQLREYQTRHGHNTVLNMFVEKNIDLILNSAEQIDMNIIIDTIRYGNQGVNLRIWESLKTKEDIFRQIVRYFRDPCEPVLYGLLTRRYDLCSPESAEPYIKFCYENELLEYFQTAGTAEVLGLVNDWNREFFLTVFWNKLQAAEGCSQKDADLILGFAVGQRHSNTGLVSRILDRVFDTSSDRVYASLDRNLRFVYSCRNRAFLERFREGASTETLQERAHLYEIERLHGGRPALRQDGDVIRNLFEISFVAGDDSKYYFVEHFDRIVGCVNERVGKEDLSRIVGACRNVFLDEPAGYGPARIEHYLSTAGSRVDEESLDFQVSFLFGHNLRNRYTLFILLDRIIEVLKGPSCSTRTLLLRFIVPSLLCKDTVHRFIGALIPLLNSPSGTVCRLSKACLLGIDIESKEIQGIFGDLTQALVDKEYVPMFFGSLRSLVFNNYLCFNSLNLILQILFRHINDFTDDVFEILSKLCNIIKDEDIVRVGPLIFNSLNRFVVNNHYHTEDVLRVAKRYCFYAAFDDYRLLIEHFSVFRISLYTVEILKTLGSPSLNTRIVECVVGTGRDAPADDAIPYPFIAAACELDEFCVYFDRFFAVLRGLFVSGEGSRREVAVKAFREVCRDGGTRFSEETRERVTLFVVRCAIYEDYPVRLACLDITDHLPLLFIMRNDQHFLVRKKAYEMWKAAVDHPNRMLKAIHGDVLDFTRHIACRGFREALSGTVAEMAVKYPVYLEMYVGTDIADGSLASKVALQSDDLAVAGHREMKEFVLLEAARTGRLTALALRFCIDSRSSPLFHLLYKDPGNRDALVGGTDAAQLLALCSENSGLASDLYKNTADPGLIRFLGDHEVFSIMVELEERCDFRAHHRRQDGDAAGARNDVDALGMLVSAVRSSAEVESFVYRSNPLLSFFYVRKERDDHGLLARIFARAFENCRDAGQLVVRENMRYIKHCSFVHVADHGRLLSLLVAEDDRRSFERAVEIVSTRPLPEELALAVSAFLLRNYLSDTRKELSLVGIRAIYNKGHSLGYFQSIIEKSVLKRRGLDIN